MKLFNLKTYNIKDVKENTEQQHDGGKRLTHH